MRADGVMKIVTVGRCEFKGRKTMRTAGGGGSRRTAGSEVVAGASGQEILNR